MKWRVGVIKTMTTTLTLDDDAYEIAVREASRKHLPLGQIISQFVRKGAKLEIGFEEKNGVFVPELPPDSPQVGTELVLLLST
jgi:hypothetical protein